MKIIVLSDVDGCLTNGSFIYTENGKVAKTFGANDNEGVKLLRKNGIETEFITADTLGESITRHRIDDMNCKLNIVKEKDRSKYISKYLDEYDKVVFFGDGIGDAHVIKKLQSDKLIFVVPQNGRDQARAIANYICSHKGGDGAFLDLAYYICNNILESYIELYE